MKKLQLLVPYGVLILLITMLWYELFYAKPHDIPSPLIGEQVPGFSLPTLSNDTLTPLDLQHHVSLLNVFASWCSACNLEADMLMKIKNNYHVAIYGVNYKDKREDVESWLKKYGNPYRKIGDDRNGSVAIDLGVYGTPETFVISKEGKVVYRHVGALDEKSWDEIIYPLVKKYESL